MTSVRNTSVPQAKLELASQKAKVKPDKKADTSKEAAVPVAPSDAVEITEDGAGAGGGYKTVDPADNDGAGAGGGYEIADPTDNEGAGAGGGYEIVNPADGAGAGGGYKTVGIAPQNFELVSTVQGFWMEPLTVVTTSSAGIPNLSSSFSGDFYAEWLHSSQSFRNSSTAIPPLLIPPAKPDASATKSVKGEGSKS